MTNQEFSDMFSTLLNSYNTQAQFGEQASKAEIVLDEYEKSVLLTQAQDLIVKSYFDRTLNNQGQGFDDSTRRQVDFSSLIKVWKSSTPVSDSANYATATWIDDVTNIGTITAYNQTDHVLYLTLAVTTNTISGGYSASYSNNHLILTISYTSLHSSGNIPSSIEGFKSPLESLEYTAGHTVSELVTFTITKQGDNPISEENYNVFDNVAIPVGIESGAFDSRGKIYKMPTVTRGTKEVPDVLFILNEKMISGTKEYVVVPISYAEYDREMSKPFAQPLKKQAWRIFHNVSSQFDMYSELIPKWSVTGTPTYKIRYVRRPQPIVLESLPDGLSIDGVTSESPCELNPILHIDILNKAVELAITTRGGGAPASYDRTAQRSESR